MAERLLAPQAAAAEAKPSMIPYDKIDTILLFS
jgi:hypothetical protein